LLFRNYKIKWVHSFVKLNLSWIAGAVKPEFYTSPPAEYLDALQLSAGQLRKTPASTVKEIDRLLEHHGLEEIARLLNQNGFKPGEVAAFTRGMVAHICQVYTLKSRRERELARGFLTRAEVAALLNIKEYRVTKLLNQGYLRKHATTGSSRELYESPTKREIKLIAAIPSSKRGRPPKLFS